MKQRTSADIEQAKSDLCGLIKQLETGSCDEVIILRGGNPVARLLPVAPAAIKLGVADGKFLIPDDIDVLNPSVDATFNPIDRDDAPS